MRGHHGGYGPDYRPWLPHPFIHIPMLSQQFPSSMVDVELCMHDTFVRQKTSRLFHFVLGDFVHSTSKSRLSPQPNQPAPAVEIAPGGYLSPQTAHHHLKMSQFHVKVSKKCGIPKKTQFMKWTDSPLPPVPDKPMCFCHAAPFSLPLKLPAFQPCFSDPGSLFS